METNRLNFGDDIAMSTKDNPFNLYPEEYEQWFVENSVVFESELLAVKQLLPKGKTGIEIGVGSGIFAEKLGICYGIDPSEIMLTYARQRNIKVDVGFAEQLPYPDGSFDFAAFITSICFLDDVSQALDEAHRVIKAEGELITAFIDRDSYLGRVLSAKKEESKFYKVAQFYSVAEMISLLESHYFTVNRMVQTVQDPAMTEIEQPLDGHGKGGFVVISSRREPATQFPPSSNTHNE